jgi:hypothetical protein
VVEITSSIETARDIKVLLHEWDTAPLSQTILLWKGRVLRNDEPVPTPLHVTHEQRDCTGEGTGIDRSNTVMGQVPMEAGVGKIPQSRNVMGANPTAKRNHTLLCFYSSSFFPMVEVARASPHSDVLE